MKARANRGFTLTELAVVLTIVALLLSSLMYTLAAQTEARTRDETTRRLEYAKELVLSFAIVNGRLPCPARCSNWPTCNAVNDGGDEMPAVGFPMAAGGGACSDNYTGYLPAKTIGFQPTDAAGYALDAWGNRIRYAVSQVTTPVGTAPHFTSTANLKLNGITTVPNDLVICASSTFAGFNAATGTCPSPSTNVVTNVNVVAAMIWSHGKNYTAMPAGNVDEQVNNKHRLPAALNNNPTFVWHDVRPVGAAGGEFDDILVWIPASQLYGRLIAAGMLP